ncbi:RusA family crossover junction endodeoxyribonuclease [Candidatus Methanomassiliicoccus intestinalis]|uniref:RusA family crossover junction endodeoxyribonuclease n=1 Tax=Candidatus Methanomassiliicoccus intestinalis TaxID=1406512 RepID=UPI0037DC74A0
MPIGEPLETLEFSVLGEPSPEGSTRAYYIKKINKTVVTHSNQGSLEAWRNRVATEAQRALEESCWIADSSSAYALDVDFYLTRPASVQPHKRLHPIVKPDLDKFIRAINDALTGILFADDCQVIALNITKTYDDNLRPGAHIKAYRYANTTAKPKKIKKEEVELGPLDEFEEEYEDPRD